VTFTVEVESALSPGATSLIAAAQDELDRRYGPSNNDQSDLRAEEMDPPTGAFVVARLDGHLAAGVGVRTIGAPGERVGEIKRLWVRPDLRGSGVARLVMDRAIEAARDLGLHRLYLETGPRQPEAQAFYAKTGWERVEHFPAGAHVHAEGIKFARDL
jgi:GNAT superfamily N-acetyltransferase